MPIHTIDDRIPDSVHLKKSSAVFPKKPRMKKTNTALSSQNKGVKVNGDGSVDVYFGPKAPEGEANNWVQTIPGKGWFMILRLYGPLEPWFDKTWRPGEIEPQP